jgi:hypothetical protein
MSIETMKLALEALIVYACKAEHKRTHADNCQAEEAITALRQAIEQAQKQEQEPIGYLCENAVGHKYFRWKKPDSSYKPVALYTSPPQRQPEQEPVAMVMPVATVISETGDESVTMSWWHEPALPVGTQLYTTSPQRQPEQEPVAWRWENAGQDKWLNKYTYLDNGAPDCPEECEPLYTSPPQRQPLTDESTKIMREMLEVQGQHGNWNYDSYMHGLYNGMEYMVALAEKREPQFRDAPNEWLAKYEVKRDNFNNVVECKTAHGIKGEK